MDIPESVAGVILIGFSVDYCVHLAHAYMESGATSRQERVQDAVTCMGISITAGAATTFMAGVFLFGAVRCAAHTLRRSDRQRLDTSTRSVCTSTPNSSVTIHLGFTPGAVLRSHWLRRESDDTRTRTHRLPHQRLRF